MWNLMDSNHINWIFSPVHTPCLPKFLNSCEDRIRTYDLLRMSGDELTPALPRTSIGRGRHFL